MEKFEIHITGYSPDIISHLKEKELKGIIIDLLNKTGEIISTEYMSSIVKEFFNFDECKDWVENLVRELLDDNCKIQRVKIECPFYLHYVNQSEYIDSHFTPHDYNYPISKNIASGKLIATDREYSHEKYSDFKSKYDLNKNAETELCLFDTNANGDKHWFDLYK